MSSGARAVTVEGVDIWDGCSCQAKSLAAQRRSPLRLEARKSVV